MATFDCHSFLDCQYVACLNCTRQCYFAHGIINARPDIHPSFVTLVTSIMLPSHPECCMKFPQDFADSVLSKCVGEAELEGSSGWVWFASLELDQTSMCLKSPGWGDFAMDNGLEVGDVVMFTYVGRNRFKIRLYNGKDGNEKGTHYLPAKRKVYDDQVLKEQGSGRISQELGSVCKTQNILETPKDGSPLHKKATRTDEKMLSFSTAYYNKDYQETYHAMQKEGSRLCDSALRSHECGQCALTKDKSSGMPRCMNRYKNILRSHGGLGESKDSMPDSQVLAHLCSTITDSEKIRVIEEANAFQSKYPIMRKLLDFSSLDRDHKLIFPESFVERYLPDRDTVIKFVDPLGRKWDCEWLGSSRKTDKKSPYVSGGWCPFAKEHGLQENDICIFELTDSENLQFNVHIFKAKQVHIPINLI